MLSKTCVKAALLLIPPGAASHHVPPPYVCHPLSRCSRSAFAWVVVAVPFQCCVGRCWGQNPLQDLPAWPVGHPSCSPVSQPTCSLGMAVLCALGCLACSRMQGTACSYPSLPHRVNASWESSDATRQGWQIYRQPQITVNAGY